jgi:release factor glutamine methyltransferase
MKTLQFRINEAAKEIKAVAKNPMREARLLLAHALNTTYEEVYVSQEHLISEEEENSFKALIERRLQKEPLSKIKEHREFWSLPFRVTRDTLDPRPDSETLIEAVVACVPDKTHPLRILDLGTGTGCLLLSLLHEYPHSTGVGVDLSERAILIAQENASRLNLEERSAFMVGSWGEAIVGTFDVIISNPPYIGSSEPLPPEVALYDPQLALDGGEDGLSCYRALSEQIPRLAKALFSFTKCVASSPDINKIERCLIFTCDSMTALLA